jgi:hypothetical protein
MIFRVSIGEHLKGIAFVFIDREAGYPLFKFSKAGQAIIDARIEKKPAALMLCRHTLDLPVSSIADYFNASLQNKLADCHHWSYWAGRRLGL